jgi:putative tricarboxylic transport membrane protein
MPVVKNRDLVSSLFWIGVGAVYCRIALNYGLFTSGAPDAGLLPFLAGLILITLSIPVLILAIKKNKVDKNTTVKFFPERDSWKKLSVSISAIIAYMLLLEYLGFIATTFSFMLFLLSFEQPRRWTFIFIVSFSTAASFYVFLKVLLKVQLPSGILGV